jgi:SAM-dependent methyltransferase
VAHYDAQYAGFGSSLYADIRRETFGEDLGQNGWLTSPELALFIDWLQLKPGHHLPDVACGSGGPTAHVAKATGCHATGIDIHEQGIMKARALAEAQGFADRVKFQRHDASQPLPFAAASFDAVLCVDAVSHLPNRPLIFAEWARVLKPGSRLVFTDPIVMTGWLTHQEIAVRSCICFYLFVPRGDDERWLEAVGLSVVASRDLTDGAAPVAGRWRAARARQEVVLRQIEGDRNL